MTPRNCRAKAALTVLLGVALHGIGASTGQAQPQGKPNIVVIWGDDIGWYNVTSAPTTTA